MTVGFAYSAVVKLNKANDSIGPELDIMAS